jgi:hydroxymethylpyrimidine pyrophosphatase-like HAD family hydrolase
VLLATGRSLYYGLKIAYKLRIQYYTKVVILYNGGLILKINPDFTREILKENFFDNESSNYLFQLATQLKIGFIGYSVEEFEKAYINKLSKLRLILRL